MATNQKTIMPEDPLKLKPRNNRPPQLRSKVKDFKLDQKRKEAYEMVLANTPVSEIAEHFGVAAGTIYDWINSEHEKLSAQLTKMGQIYRGKLNKNNDDLLRQWMPLALAIGKSFKVKGIKYNKKGEPTIIDLKDWEIASLATEKVLKIGKQISDINGLNIQLPENGTTGDRKVDLTLIHLVQNLVGQPKVIEGTIIDAPVNKLEE